MPEKTKRKEDNPKKKEPDAPFFETDENNWSKDQLEKNYYYDDAHGYEIYNPYEEENDED